MRSERDTEEEEKGKPAFAKYIVCIFKYCKVARKIKNKRMYCKLPFVHQHESSHTFRMLFIRICLSPSETEDTIQYSLLLSYLVPLTVSLSIRYCLV